MNSPSCEKKRFGTYSHLWQHRTAVPPSLRHDTTTVTHHHVDVECQGFPSQIISSVLQQRLPQRATTNRLIPSTLTAFLPSSCVWCAEESNSSHSQNTAHFEPSIYSQIVFIHLFSCQHWSRSLNSSSPSLKFISLPIKLNYVTSLLELVLLPRRSKLVEFSLSRPFHP